MTERRYNEEEVAAIFERATSSPHAGQRHLASGDSDGMTLAELQTIGREVGIAPGAIAESANAVAQRGRVTSRTILGLPLAVGRTVELKRKLTDEEWERVVVDLRETFDARGTVRSDGSLRQWTNGNLQALLEPTATGHRVRLRTMKGDARAMMFGGATMLGAAVFGLAMAAVRGATGDTGMLLSLATLGWGGAVMLGIGAFRLPGWAKLRQRQMEDVAGRISTLADSEPSGG